jgi:hypothetical protein
MACGRTPRFVLQAFAAGRSEPTDCGVAEDQARRHVASNEPHRRRRRNRPGGGARRPAGTIAPRTRSPPRGSRGDRNRTASNRGPPPDGVIGLPRTRSSARPTRARLPWRRRPHRASGRPRVFDFAYIAPLASSHTRGAPEARRAPDPTVLPAGGSAGCSVAWKGEAGLPGADRSP